MFKLTSHSERSEHTTRKPRAVHNTNSHMRSNSYSTASSENSLPETQPHTSRRSRRQSRSQTVVDTPRHLTVMNINPEIRVGTLTILPLHSLPVQTQIFAAHGTLLVIATLGNRKLIKNRTDQEIFPD